VVSSFSSHAVANFLWKCHVSNFYSIDALETVDYPNDEDRDIEMSSASEDTSTEGEEDHIDVDDENETETEDENPSQCTYNWSRLCR
jgi:DNA-directed RNA polymerase delta subunit